MSRSVREILTDIDRLSIELHEAANDNPTLDRRAWALDDEVTEIALAAGFEPSECFPARMSEEAVSP